MKITVVVPAYNEEVYLGACLESLHRQSRPADEILVVNNNSIDQTEAIARRYSATVISEKRQGIWAASRAGYSAANGDVIARCDADSVLPHDWLERIEGAFSQNHVIAVTGPGNFYGTSKIVCRLADVLYMKAYFISVGAALGHPPLFGSNFAMRKTAWLAAKKQTHHNREDIHDDIDLSYHLPGKKPVVYDPDLRVLISARPLFQASGMVNRYQKGFRSIVLHWPAHAPWRR